VLSAAPESRMGYEPRRNYNSPVLRSSGVFGILWHLLLNAALLAALWPDDYPAREICIVLYPFLDSHFGPSHFGSLAGISICLRCDCRRNQMSRQTLAEAMVDTLEAAGVKRIYGAPETRSMA
jgi:hypothetical protein